MGCGTSADAAKNAAIEKELKARGKDMQQEIRLLLLGAGESGKSTVVKQMKILYKSGYQAKEVQLYKTIVQQNLMQCQEQLLLGLKRLELDIEDEELVSDLESLFPDGKPSGDLTSAHYDLLKRTWQDAVVQQAYARRNEFQLNDSCAYFFGRVDEVRQSDYLPTTEDILYCRVRTTGITETNFEYQGMRFTLVDVGGQRNERKKWIHFFEGVTAILFVVALSEYDQMLFEDESVNRMQESLKLFDEIANNKFFKDTSIILFLNKEDLFDAKVKSGIPITVCFPEYQGAPDDTKASKDYITEQFQALNRNPAKQIYRHYTTATDTNNTRVVFVAVTDIVLNANLADMGMV